MALVIVRKSSSYEVLNTGHDFANVDQDTINWRTTKIPKNS